MPDAIGASVAEKVSSGQWELAGAIRLAASADRISVVGGWDEPGATGLHIVVQHPTDENLVKRIRVRIPWWLDEDDLVVGDPEIL